MAWTDKLRKLGAAALSDFRARADSWSNALTGLNTSRDKTASTLPVEDWLLTPLQQESLFHNDDIANRIVSAVPDECFREPWAIVNAAADEDEKETTQEQTAELEEDLRQLNAREKFREAMTWGRLFGLGAMYIGIDDGRDPWEPVDWSNIRSVDFLTVLDKLDLIPWRWYADVEAPKFGDVAIYLLQPVGVYVGMPYDIQKTLNAMLVHEERLIRFGGELTSKRRKLANQSTDYGVLQRCFRALQLTNDNWQSAAALLADASQGVLTIKGLIDMISQQSDVMTSRFAFMDMSRSVARAIVLDADGEKFERVPSRFEGIPQMLEQTWKRLASAARMPLTILMGTSPAGMDATGESDIRWWYDSIRGMWVRDVKPRLEYLVKLQAASKGWDTYGWTATPPALWQMTDKELAEMHYQQSQADNLDIENGKLLPEEAALSRFGGGKYSLETTIDVDTRKAILGTRAKQLQLEAVNEVEAAKDPGPTPGDRHAQQQENAAAKPPDADGEKRRPGHGSEPGEK